MGCSHFSPVAEAELVDVEQFKRDFTRMGEIFNHRCANIALLGGEPLLHPQINTLMKIARDNFTHGIIRIITNGLLLMSMGNEFWQTCHDNKIRIDVTYYPVHLDTEGIIRTAKKFGVELIIDNETKAVFRKDPIDLTGSQDIRDSFAMCQKANSCSTLKHGRLYECSFTPHIEHFNKAFNQHIEVTQDDYIDIYRDGLTKDEILNWLCKPVPSCRYCQIRKADHNITWRTSKREMSEWV